MTWQKQAEWLRGRLATLARVLADPRASLDPRHRHAG